MQINTLIRPPRKADTPRAGWFDAPEEAAENSSEQQEWQALNAVLLNDDALDAEWQW